MSTHTTEAIRLGAPAQAAPPPQTIAFTGSDNGVQGTLLALVAVGGVAIAVARRRPEEESD